MPRFRPALFFTVPGIVLCWYLYSASTLLAFVRPPDHGRVGGGIQDDPRAFTRRVVAVGDLHGDLPNARKVLMMAGVVDANGDWSGNIDVFVQTGDMIDR
jgi:hypothetical protein